MLLIIKICHIHSWCNDYFDSIRPGQDEPMVPIRVRNGPDTRGGRGKNIISPRFLMRDVLSMDRGPFYQVVVICEWKLSVSLHVPGTGWKVHFWLLMQGWYYPPIIHAPDTNRCLIPAVHTCTQRIPSLICMVCMYYLGMLSCPVHAVFRCRHLSAFLT